LFGFDYKLERFGRVFIVGRLVGDENIENKKRRNNGIRFEQKGFLENSKKNRIFEAKFDKFNLSEISSWNLRKYKN